MKPEIQSITFHPASLFTVVKVNDSLSISVTLPIPAAQYEKMTVDQISDAAVQHARSQNRE